MSPWLVAVVFGLLSVLFLMVNTGHSDYVAGIFGAMMTLGIGNGFEEARSKRKKEEN